MAKGSPAGKSEAVREFLSKHSKANVKEIVAGVFRESGIRVSEKLAGDIKYDKATHPVPAAAKPKKKSGGRPRRAARSSGAGTKADAIRDAARQLPKPVRPRDVIAALTAKGVHATRAQVSQVLKSMGMRPRRRRAARGTAAAASHTRAGSTRRTPIAATTSISLADLLAAKRLVSQIGSIELAKEAVDALAKLT